MIRRKMWLPLFVLGGGLMAYGCNGTEAAVEKSAGPELADVLRRTLDIRAEAAGLVEPITMVEVKSKASGEVTSVLVETGQEVERGTLLVEIEPRDVRNAYAQAEADLEVAKARAETSDAQYKRVQELRKANVATEQELESAQLDAANARAALVKAQTSLELARERMNDVTIRAPLSGTVISKTVEPGAIIASASGTFGGGSTLITMADLSTVQVRALIDQTDIGRIQPGQEALVTVEAYPNRQFEGEVVKIEPQAVVDQNVTMFPVLIQLDNRERLLRPGMNTEVQIDIARRPDALVVPNDAIVAMRDMNSVGMALGLSEDEIREKMDAGRAARMNGGQPAGNGPTGPEAARPAGQEGGAHTAQAPGPQGGAQAPQASGPQGGAQAAQASGPQGGAPAGGEMRPGNGRPGGNGRASFGGPGNGRGGAGSARRPGQARPGVIFVATPNGPEPRMVMLGVNDWEHTEVISGLSETDKVYLITALRLQQQQQEMTDRMRQRNTGPFPGAQRQQGGRGGSR